MVRAFVPAPRDAVPPDPRRVFVMVVRLEDAVALFERLLTHANCAYTHVGLINTAMTISELIDAREMRFRAWS